MAEADELQAIRAKIDELDAKIQALISDRASCAEEVARIKREAGEHDGFYRPEREAEVLRQVIARNQGPLADAEIANLFREVMAVCRSLQQSYKIAYLGPEGTFTHAAALKHFGQSVPVVAHPAIETVFREVEAGHANYGVVPVENSTEGVINHTLDTFLSSNLKICGEVELRIHHHLLSKGHELTAIRRIYSHQQSLAQCRHWLNENMPGIETVAVSSNAEAAKIAATEENAAAIASDAAAGIYSLDILASNIEDNPNNTTRFIVIGNHAVAASGQDKTSILVSANNRPGALYELLAPIAKYKLSMNRIESRPSQKGMWEYVFFIDVDGHQQDENVRQALDELAQSAAMLKILGSYPKAIL
jgi:chorismate mutase/prephenate dehydratase